MTTNDIVITLDIYYLLVGLNLILLCPIFRYYNISKGLRLQLKPCSRFSGIEYDMK